MTLKKELEINISYSLVSVVIINASAYINIITNNLPQQHPDSKESTKLTINAHKSTYKAILDSLGIKSYTLNEIN